MIKCPSMPCHFHFGQEEEGGSRHVIVGGKFRFAFLNQELLYATQ